MNHLLRNLAPISDAAWGKLDEEARERLEPALAARRLIEFSGPHGWAYSATNARPHEPLSSAPCTGVSGRQRRVLPLVEVRAEFELSLEELRDSDRGAADADLEPLDKAAHQIAVAENIAVFHGWDGAIAGIADARRMTRSRSASPPTDIRGRSRLRCSGCSSNGISGPYALALGGEQYQRVVETAEHGGYPLLEHLHKILDGPIVWAPGVKGAVVVSLRGGDFLFESGQDLSLGYTSHTADRSSCISRRASASTSRRRRRRSC